ncbi:xylulose 5-phosphate 3-epimerase, partial [Pseudomonas aeruginosa]
NAAHKLPLPGNPHNDEQARQLFNQQANELWVEPEALELARRLFAEQRGERPLERDNPLPQRHPIEPIIPPLPYRHDA